MRLIDADELLNELDRHAFDFGLDDLHMLEDVINDMPTVEQKHGHWELKRRIADVNWWSCSKCGRITDLGMGLKTPPYCQWCGAKMDEVTEDEH